MSKYSYKLYKANTKSKEHHTTYPHSQLIKMTTYQLKEICYKEKLIKNVLDPLNREELIRLIIRYRGRDEASYITTYNEEGLTRLEEYLQKVQINIQHDLTLHVPAKFTIYEHVEVSLFDDYKVKADSVLFPGNVLLVNEHNEICTIFNLVELRPQEYYLIKSKDVPIHEKTAQGHKLLYVDYNTSERFYELYQREASYMPTHINVYEIPILEFNIKKLNPATMPLVIDFGSSNTTIGIYEDEMKLVEVMGAEGFKATPLIPSCIAVKKIADDAVHYAFAYEAIALENKNYIDEDIPIFYDIKRWISDAARLEKITDSSGKQTLIARKQLLKAYLEYIIELAQSRFKLAFNEIQFLAPVRQKVKFESVLKEILDGYKVSCEIDEGVAVIFHSISNLIKKNHYENNQWYHALVIDCGGGTTDLTSCNFKIENRRVDYNITLQAAYENGDTNFGGNNLTFRIMQLLKIMLVEKYAGKKLWENNLHKYKNFRQVDEVGKAAVYKALNEAYTQAEAICPTLFKEYENHSPSQYFKVKNNFYELYHIAENIKKTFFMRNEIYEMNIASQQQPCIDEREAYIFIDKWKISVVEGHSLLPIKEVPPMKLYWHEISSLLEADIYQLMKKFLEDLFEDGELSKYEMIKLMGQSCKVSLFREALKEFIPGRIIQDNSEQRDEYELKLGCIYGALQYFQSKKLGYMAIEQNDEVGALPYQITGFTHEHQEKILIHSLEKQEHTGSISRFMEGDELQLYLKDSEGTLLRQYKYIQADSDFEPTTFYEIDEMYPKHITQDETDNIVNGETKYFVWVSRAEWGFYVMPILRQQEGLFRGKQMFFEFEDDTWEQNFFDGLK